MPHDFRELRTHYISSQAGTITGVLYQGDNKTKYSVPNEPTIDRFTSVNPSDFTLIDQLNNAEESSAMMLAMIDTDEEKRQILPTLPTTAELLEFRVSSERHGAYEALWNGLSFAGVVANTAIWLYF